MYFFSLLLGKLVLFVSKLLGSAGSTWPGHVAIEFYPSFLKDFQKRFNGKIIVVAGTNGKTTTSKIIKTILKNNGNTMLHNKSGANLLNGIASSIINNARFSGEFPQYAIFEVDENTLPLLLQDVTPDYLIILNLFRDQLDRYGEVDLIATKWKKALKQLPAGTRVFLNADDPHVAFLGSELRASVGYFGIEDVNLYLPVRPHAMDAIYCPQCGNRLLFEGIYFSHLGKWECEGCGFKRPVFEFMQRASSLTGIYNMYNTQAAILTAHDLGIDNSIIEESLTTFVPAFGRQESFDIKGKHVKIFLAKNPTGFNESIRVIKELGGKHFLLVLNDRIPDGRDISWIWDVDTEELVDKGITVIASGDRSYDLGLRLKYSASSEFSISNFQFSVKNLNFKFQIEENLKKAIIVGLRELTENETLYILPTYSAMLEVRKILGGRKIL